MWFIKLVCIILLFPLIVIDGVFGGDYSELFDILRDNDKLSISDDEPSNGSGT